MLDLAAMVVVAFIWLAALYQFSGWMWRSIVLRRAGRRILPVGPVSTRMPTSLVEGPVQVVYVEPLGAEVPEPLREHRTLVLPRYVGPCSSCGADAGLGCWDFCPDRAWRSGA